MGNFIDLAGKQFGRLTAISVARRRPVGWLCRCVCGVEKVVLANKLRMGSTKSCGCAQADNRSQLKHGGASKGARHPEYGIWLSMRNRCHLPSAVAYKDYGGRGIYVCHEWRNDYARFLADMGPRPGKGYGIERINNDGPYSPSNCRWASILEQQNNRRSNVRLTYLGKEMTIAEWSREVGVPQPVISKRLRRGWSVEETLTAPLMTAAESGRRGLAKRYGHGQSPVAVTQRGREWKP